MTRVIFENINMKQYIALLLIAFTFNSSATGIPTVDIANLIPANTTALAQLKANLVQLKQHAKQVEDLKAQYDQLIKLKEQLSTAKDTLGSVTGIRNMAKVFNNPLIQEQRKNLPAEWQDVFDTSQDLNSAVAGTIYDINKAKTRLRMKNYMPGSEVSSSLLGLETVLERSTRRVNNITNTDAIATTTYQSAGQQMSQIEDWIGAIDQQKDLKASLDLNNRMMAELLVNQNRLLQIFAANTKLSTNQSETDIAAKASDNEQSRISGSW